MFNNFLNGVAKKSCTAVDLSLKPVLNVFKFALIEMIVLL